MNIFLNKEVTINNVGNYKVEYAEEVPFKAILVEVTDYPCYWVRSLKTGKEYEVYSAQIDEFEKEKVRWEQQLQHINK